MGVTRIGVIGGKMRHIWRIRVRTGHLRRVLLGVLTGVHFLRGELVDVRKGAAVCHRGAVHRTAASLLHLLVLVLVLVLLLQVHLLDLLPVHRVHWRGLLRLQATVLVHVGPHQGQTKVCHDHT